MYRSALSYLIVFLSPWLLIMLANRHDPNNKLFAAFQLGFVAVAIGIGVLWHLLSKGANPLTLFPQNGSSRVSANWVTGAHLRRIEFGEFADNLEALVILRSCLARGEIVESYPELVRLREHITLRGDPKSVALLLPAIDYAIGRTR